MRNAILVALFAASICGCDLVKTESNDNGNLNAAFTLTDTTGRAATAFHPGEEFIVSVSLINTTEDTLTYYRGNSGPAVIFQIVNKDTIVATSVDGYVFLQVALLGHLPPRDTLRGYWKAPTTPAQNPKVVLSPGWYQAEVVLPAFEGATVNPVSPIAFRVVE